MKQEVAYKLGGLLSPQKARDRAAKVHLGGCQWAGRFRVPLILESFPESPLQMLSPSSLCVLMSIQEGSRERERKKSPYQGSNANQGDR